MNTTAAKSGVRSMLINLRAMKIYVTCYRVRGGGVNGGLSGQRVPATGGPGYIHQVQCERDS